MSSSKKLGFSESTFIMQRGKFRFHFNKDTQAQSQHVYTQCQASRLTLYIESRLAGAWFKL